MNHTENKNDERTEENKRRREAKKMSGPRIQGLVVTQMEMF